MNIINPENIILKPIITEKSLAAQSQGKYYFWVNKTASKTQIAKAFETVFAVKPLSVNTVSLKGKIKTDWKKRLPIIKPDRKRAVITIKKDQKLELLQLNTK